MGSGIRLKNDSHQRKERYWQQRKEQKPLMRKQMKALYNTKPQPIELSISEMGIRIDRPIIDQSRTNRSRTGYFGCRL